MSVDPKRMCELLLGLDNVVIISVVRNFFTGQLRVEIGPRRRHLPVGGAAGSAG